MRYEYSCETCNLTFDLDFAMGKAPKTVKCECGKTADRSFGNVGFILKGGGWPSKSMKMNSEQTAKNERAGHRMRKERKPVKTVAHDYGGGDIREA